MPKRISVKEKEEIIKSFLSGKTIDEIATKYNFTKLTISRNLKKNLGKVKYKEILTHSNANNYLHNDEHEDISDINQENNLNNFETSNNFLKEESLSSNSFTEIVPLNYDIENSFQKDLSSTPISAIELPNIVYMLVDHNSELEIKLLKDHPEWQFLPEEDLNRKTIQIFSDLKIAKRFCNKNQKVIKVPNTDVFKIAAPKLLEKGITRIVSSEKLLAL